jgi:4-hydroxybenzoate polyprenyltransferase
LEYAPGEIPAMLTVLFLGSMTLSRFFDFIVIEALFAFILLYLSGFIINAITDVEIDKNYDTFKTSIPKSVELLGERTLWGLIIGHVAIATALSVHISLVMNSFIPLALVLLGTFFGLGYSIRPFQFKVRGIWHAIALGSSAFFLPFIFLMFVVANGISLPLLLFIAGFSFVHYGMEFGNQAIDYVEDKASDVRTPPVRWGMIPSLRIALGCVFVGILTEAYAIYSLLLIRGSFTFIHPILTTNVLFTALMGIILVGYYIPTKGLWDMLSTLKKSETIEDGMPTLKKICNYAKWQTSGILGVAVVAGILFLGVAYGPASQIATDSNGGFNPSESNLNFGRDPEVEFFHEDGEGWFANVTVSIQNDKTHRDWGSLMTIVQSRVANWPPISAKSILMEKELKPYQFWNFTTRIRAHESDDTSFEITIMADKTGLDVYEPVTSRVIPSQKDLYILDVSVKAYEDMIHNKWANVTVTVYNEGDTLYIGDLYLEVWYYYLGYSDYDGAENEISISTNGNWVRTLTINSIEVDEISEPFFVIKLYHDGKFVDDFTHYGYD